VGANVPGSQAAQAEFGLFRVDVPAGQGLQAGPPALVVPAPQGQHAPVPLLQASKPTEHAAARATAADSASITNGRAP